VSYAWSNGKKVKWEITNEHSLELQTIAKMRGNERTRERE